MTVFQIEDRRAIESVLRRDIGRHIYELGDLDEFFWPDTRWYAIGAPEAPTAVVLEYRGGDTPAVLALSSHTSALSRLLREVSDVLPDEFFMHVSPGCCESLGERYRRTFLGRQLRMLLRDVPQVDTGVPAKRIGPENLQELSDFYAKSYPDNWFDPRMLDTGCYFGVRRNGILVSAAGVHSYSPDYGVAAIGNVATHPNYRNRGLGKVALTALIRSLRDHVDHIGLNVGAHNSVAIRAYRSLGFSAVCEFEEWRLSR
ncbi:MAG: GNAT family N-acetyltransferase [Spirochaetales bacterium]